MSDKGLVSKMTVATDNFDIQGMHCAACATRIEKVVANIEGVIDIHVNLATEKGRVTYDKQATTITPILQKIKNIGFEAKTASENTQVHANEKQMELTTLKRKFILSALLTFPLAWAMFSHFNWTASIYIPELFQQPYFQLALTIPIQFIIGYPFYANAWKALKNGSANMDVLVVLSTSAAFFYSHYLTFSPLSSNQTEPVVLYYETCAFIITFILLGRYLEAKTKWKTTEAIQQLYELQTNLATLYKNGKEFHMPITDIVPGNIIIVKPGEKVPMDGQVINGASLINESLLTGESTPVHKGYGNLVYAGTINQNGALQIKVTKRDDETTLSQIIRVVEEAQISKAPIQHIADKVTGVFVPIVIVIALTTFAAWYLFFHPGHFNEALEKMITVLIIACPCALGLATPTSVMVGSGRATQRGILFKEGKYLELLSKCTTIIFDKTGTLTKGTPQVTDIYSEDLYEKELLTIIGAVEQHSEHPIAKAITTLAMTKTPHLPNASQVISLPGYGVKAIVNGKSVMIANPNYFLKNNLSIPSHMQQVMTTLTEEAKTVMIVQIDTSFAGVIAVADEIKSSAAPTVTRLKQMGFTVGMLTGDNKSTGLAVAEDLRITTLRTEVPPQDKATFIKQLQKKGHRVMMVGDGINDAPALTVANVGVALGTGSDIAIDSGDVTIMKGDIERLIEAIIISKKTMINIKQNLLWAFLYNIIMIPFAMLGFLAPWLAGAAMALSSVSVVLNSLRLKRVHLHKYQ